MKKIVLIAALVAVTVVSHQMVSAHCQIPCGIYDDPARFTALAEHITTIEKSMNQIGELSKDPGANANQVTRWVMNKEDHADQLSAIVTEYFLQQRIKPVAAGSGHEREVYVGKLVACHQMLVASMKAKQTTDLGHVRTLRESLSQFKTLYEHKH